MIMLTHFKFTTYENTTRGKAVCGHSRRGELLTSLKPKPAYYSLELTQ